VELVRGVGMSVVRVGKFYGRLVLRRMSKIAFGKLFWSSFKWLLAIDSAWMWNHSIVFKCGPFLWQFSTCMISFIGPKECAASLRCFVKLYAWFLLWKAVLCSLYLVKNRLPICPTLDFCNRGRKVCMPQIVSICTGGFLCVSRFPIVFFVRRAILRSVRLKMFVMYKVFLLIYVNLANLFGGARPPQTNWPDSHILARKLYTLQTSSDGQTLR